MPDPDFPLRSVFKFYPRGPHPVLFARLKLCAHAIAPARAYKPGLTPVNCLLLILKLS